MKGKIYFPRAANWKAKQTNKQWMEKRNKSKKTQNNERKSPSLMLHLAPAVQHSLFLVEFPPRTWDFGLNLAKKKVEQEPQQERGIKKAAWNQFAAAT